MRTAKISRPVVGGHSASFFTGYRWLFLRGESGRGMKLNLLKPTGYGMRQQVEYFNNCMLCPYCIYVFCICLRTNRDLCHLHKKLNGFYTRDEKCLQRGTDWASAFRLLKVNNWTPWGADVIARICTSAPPYTPIAWWARTELPLLLCLPSVDLIVADIIVGWHYAWMKLSHFSWLVQNGHLVS
jgi:hypothetical protein